MAGDAEVTVDAVLDSVVGGIEVIADVSAPWRGECRRCLRPVVGRVEAHVRELYRARDHDEHGRRHTAVHGPGRATGHSHGHSEEEEDEETYPLRGELLDLQPLVRDAILLELPLAPLCAESCKGLCATCGADLNDGPCSCDPTPADPRWAALSVLEADQPESRAT